MGLWVESWLGSLVVYCGLASWVFPGLPNWTSPLLVGLVWGLWAAASIRDGIRHHAAARVAMGAVIQGGVVAVSAFACSGRLRLTAPHYLAAGTLIAIAAALVSLETRRRTWPEPYYGAEAFAVTIFGTAHLIAMASQSPLRVLVALLALHSGALAVALLRNTSVEAQRVEGPVVIGGYEQTVWHVRRREPGGIRALRTAMALPSGVVGSGVVLAELALLIVFARLY